MSARYVAMTIRIGGEGFGYRRPGGRPEARPPALEPNPAKAQLLRSTATRGASQLPPMGWKNTIAATFAFHTVRIIDERAKVRTWI